MEDQIDNVQINIQRAGSLTDAGVLVKLGFNLLQPVKFQAGRTKKHYTKQSGIDA
jgi:hypothetical protein